MNNVEINALDVDIPEWSEPCRTYTEKVLSMLGINDWEVSLAFCSNDYIRRLNSKYRHIDDSTDVLSFSQEYYSGSGQSIPAGDIVISLEKLASNAKEYGVSEEEELKRLIIHGILHLKGMDHTTNDQEEEMIRIQETLLKEPGEEIF